MEELVNMMGRMEVEKSAESIGLTVESEGRVCGTLLRSIIEHVMNWIDSHPEVEYVDSTAYVYSFRVRVHIRFRVVLEEDRWWEEDVDRPIYYNVKWTGIVAMWDGFEGPMYSIPVMERGGRWYRV